eukprot:2373951-Rhodomonas_salina.5
MITASRTVTLILAPAASSLPCVWLLNARCSQRRDAARVGGALSGRGLAPRGQRPPLLLAEPQPACCPIADTMLHARAAALRERGAQVSLSRWREEEKSKEQWDGLEQVCLPLC